MAAGLTHTTDESGQLVEAARALGPQIRESVQEMEHERRLPVSFVRAMQQAGAFRMTMPKE